MNFNSNIKQNSALNLRNLSDEALHQNTLGLAHHERQTTLEVLHHLREVERRSLFAVRAYSSLFEYVVNELKYSAGAAHRRIASMRLLNELPELEKKVESGILNLSALSQAQTFFRHEKSNVAEKREVIKELENKSSKQVERELASRSSNSALMYQEKVRSVSAEHSELKILIDQEMLAQIEKLRCLLAHKMPRASLKDLLEYAVDHTVEHAVEGLKPKLTNSKLPKLNSQKQKLEEQNLATLNSEKQNSAVKNHSNFDSGFDSDSASDLVVKILVPAVEMDRHSGQIAGRESSRYISAAIRSKVFKRDNGRCGYIDPVGKRSCGSEYGLELDHILPFSMGGKSNIENLRLRCRAHNQLEAVKVFGSNKMARHLSRLR